jgi:serine/threonine-protein kinase
VTELLARFPEYHHQLHARLDKPELPDQAALGSITLNTPAPGHRVTSSPSAAVAGLELPGYEILAELGRGGMGVVYKARDCQLDRLVALKVIHQGERIDPELRERFRSEALALGRVRHPHIVPIHAWSETQGQPFFVMEYLSRGNLDHALRERGQPLPAEAAHLVEVLAWTVQAAHEERMIHRDLKPANVLLGPPVEGSADNTVFGFPKISDFGLVKLLDEQRRTLPGYGLGTPAYMAPEQAHGQAGVGADVYALGVILYQLLTGRVPFEGSTPLETLALAERQPPRPPRQLCPRVPPALEAICLKCLAKSPAERYPSAAALAEDLRRWRTGQRRRWPGWLATAGLAAGVLLAVILVLTWRVASTPPVPTAPAPLPLTAEWNAWVLRDTKLLRLHEQRAWPLRAGDVLRVDATLSRPAHVQVICVDTLGKAIPVYPRSPDEDRPTERLLDAEVRLEAGPPGVGVLFLLCRDGPLPPEVKPLRLLTGLGPQPDVQLDRPVWLENGQLDRAPERMGSVPLMGDNHPVLRTQKLLSGPLRQLFGTTRAVCFPFFGDE